MNDGINNFIGLLSKGDFFLIFLIVMAVVIVSVIVYLVRLQINEDPYYRVEDEETTDDEYYPSPEEKAVETSIRKFSNNIKDIEEDEENNILEDPRKVKASVSDIDLVHANYEYNNVIENDILNEETIMASDNDSIVNERPREEIEREIELNAQRIMENKIKNEIKEERHLEQERFYFESPQDEENSKKLNSTQESIEKDLKVFEENNKELNNLDKEEFKGYEREQEEYAIISASELENRLKEMRETGEILRHEEKIKAYEEEQELKAIISYEELLKRANNKVVSYEKEENIDGIRVGKVDTRKVEMSREISNKKTYYKEDEFLEALKEFRRAL